MCCRLLETPGSKQTVGGCRQNRPCLGKSAVWRVEAETSHSTTRPARRPIYRPACLQLMMRGQAAYLDLDSVGVVVCSRAAFRSASRLHYEVVADE